MTWIFTQSKQVDLMEDYDWPLGNRIAFSDRISAARVNLLDRGLRETTATPIDKLGRNERSKRRILAGALADGRCKG